MSVKNVAELVRRDCYIVCPNGKVTTSEQLNTLKNYYKEEIYNKLQGKTVGKTVVIWSNCLDVIYSSVLAIWELGCAVAVHDFSEKIVPHPAFKNFYNYIDLIIGDDTVLPDIPYIPAWATNLAYWHYENDQPEPELWRHSLEDYPDKEYQLDQPVTVDTVCVISHSSGTTGEPKVCDISHRNAIDLVKENIKIFEFSEADRVLHYKTLHHGSLFLNYAIPAFASTDHHEWFVKKHSHDIDQYNTGVLKACIELCIDHRLTKWLVPYADIQYLPKLKSADLSHMSMVTVVGPTANAMQKIFDKFNPRAVYNNFGCTEIGTIAVSKTTKETVDQYSPTKFNLINSLLDIEVEETQFRVKYKKQSDWKSIGDIIEIDNNHFIWHARNNTIKFGDKKISVHDISSWTTLFLENRFLTVVPNFLENKIYLAYYDNAVDSYKLHHINASLSAKFGKGVEFTDVRYFEFREVVNGIKPSLPILLYAFNNPVESK
jgi:hypothetical protein